MIGRRPIFRGRKCFRECNVQIWWNKMRCVFFWGGRHPHLLIIFKKDFFLSQNDHKDDTQLTWHTYCKKNVFRGAKKWGAHIGLAVFFSGVFFCPRKNHALRISKKPSKKRGKVDSVFLQGSFGFPLATSFEIRWFLGWWHWLQKQILFRVIRFPHWFC